NLFWSDMILLLDLRSFLIIPQILAKLLHTEDPVQDHNFLLDHVLYYIKLVVLLHNKCTYNHLLLTYTNLAEKSFRGIQRRHTQVVHDFHHESKATNSHQGDRIQHLD